MLPDAVLGLPHHGNMDTSNQAGGAVSVVSGVRGTGDQGQPLYQAYTITAHQDQPLTVTINP